MAASAVESKSEQAPMESSSSSSSAASSAKSNNLGTVDIADKGITWRNDDGRIEKVKSGDIKSLEWIPQGPARAQLRIRGASDKLLVLDGFDPRSRQRLSEALDTALEGRVALTDGTMAVGGGNWGEPTVVGKRLELHDPKGRPMCFLPLDGLAHLAYPGRGEVSLQYEADDTAGPEDEVLMEMKLWVPPEHPELKEQAKELGEGKTAGEALQAAMAKVADLGGAESSGDLVAEIPESQALFLTPRGRYKIEMYPTAMRMVGKTYEYRLAYKSISRMYYLPRPSQTTADSTRVNVVISLDDPIRQGQQRYPHLVMQLDVVHAAIDVLASADARKSKYGNIPAKVEGELPKVVASLLRNITGKRIFKTGEFVSRTGHKAFRSALKGNDGLLFPLDRSFFFIHKPATSIRHSEILGIEMQRMGMGAAGVASRTFDMVIRCRGAGGEQGREYTFTSIERREHAGLVRFLRGKKLSVTTDEQQGTKGQRYQVAVGADDDDGPATGGAAAMQDEDEEDSDFEEGGGNESSSDDDEDEDEDGGAGGDSGSDDDE